MGGGGVGDDGDIVTLGGEAFGDLLGGAFVASGRGVEVLDDECDFHKSVLWEGVGRKSTEKQSLALLV